MTNLEMLAHIARGLGDLKDEVVFVGGATIELYITDPGAPKVRPTDDVDWGSNILRKKEPPSAGGCTRR